MYSLIILYVTRSFGLYAAALLAIFNNIEENIRVISRRISQVKQKHLSSKEVYKALLNFDVLYSQAPKHLHYHPSVSLSPCDTLRWTQNFLLHQRLLYDNLSVEDKHYDRKYEDMSIRWSNLYDKINNIEENIRVISIKQFFPI